MNFSLNKSLFQKESINIPVGTDVVFVADLFEEDYTGGAELTSQALIDSSPFKVFKLHSSDVTLDNLRQGHQKHWIFGNFTRLNFQLLPSIIANVKYSILEYDYKYCMHRSPDLHVQREGQCDCHDNMHGKMVSAFFHGASTLWWMSRKQKDSYVSKFPFLSGKVRSTVLSSVFSAKTLLIIENLRRLSTKNDRWITLKSDSPIKGYSSAVAWCIEHGLEHDDLWNISYEDALERLAISDGFVYLPIGGDTCPRMVIEAKLLGCKLELNDNVEHASEDWFNQSIEDINAYLKNAPETFWTSIKQVVEHKPTVSGYTTTLNCVTQDYPYEESIKSMLGFCNQVVVVDGGSTDGTWEKLNELAKEDTRIVIHQQKRDWESKRFAVFDGAQKALARSLCTNEFCWQMDSDEIVHEDDYTNVNNLIKGFPDNVDIIGLPVIEYWGGIDKIRCDINAWKWRLSRNKPYITHSIPATLRKFDEDGQLYSLPGSDGCDYVRNDNFEPLPFATFLPADADKVRIAASHGNVEAARQWETWLNHIVTQVPGVYHFSWFNLERKIKTYKNYWTKHWNSLYDIVVDDTAVNNMMFDVSWKDVTDDMIKFRAKEMKEKLAGWIWHSKWDGKTQTYGIKSKRAFPKIMEKWIARNKT